MGKDVIHPIGLPNTKLFVGSLLKIRIVFGELELIKGGILDQKLGCTEDFWGFLIKRCITGKKHSKDDRSNRCCFLGFEKSTPIIQNPFFREKKGEKRLQLYKVAKKSDLRMNVTP